MLQLHPYREAYKTKYSFKHVDNSLSPALDLFSFLFDVNDWLDIKDVAPKIFVSSSCNHIYFLYPNTSLLVTEFWDCFALQMAQIHSTWPICAFGTAENHDSVCLYSEKGSDFVEITELSVSGESADIIRTLCFQLTIENADTANHLFNLFQGINLRYGVGATDWKNFEFLSKYHLVITSGNQSYFCYAGPNQDATKSDLLNSLTFSQKIQLWTAFLKNGLHPEEFEWLSYAISHDLLINQMEWELSLRESMHQLGYQIINENKDFQIYNSLGKRCYFSADLVHPTEWAFLKILFPLNY